MKYSNMALGEIASFRYGKMPNKKMISENGKYPIYSGYRVTGYYDEYNLEKDELVIVARGVGGTGDVKLSPSRCYLTNLSIAIKVNENFALKKYLYYYFAIRNLRYLDSGSAQSQITISNLEKVIIPLPNIEIQRKLVIVLSTIDNKIELNQKINDNLERQAQNIFKSWFVDFEPFGGSKPDDWAYVTLSEISKISTTVFSPQKNPNVLVEHYSIPAYDESHYPVFEMSDGIKSNKYKITNNSVIISKLNPETKRIWRPYCLSDNSICSTEFIVYEPLSSEYRDFVYSVIDSDGFSKFLCSHTTGSTNSRQRATPSVTLNYKAVLPDSETLKKFCAAVSPMYDMVEKNILESQKLAKIRDSLLPRLMSGELDVSKIEL